MKKVHIAAALRTPIGKFNGGLRHISAPKLGAIAIQSIVRQTGLPSLAVDEIYMGCALQAGLGQAPARQAALEADLPETVPCSTINKVCGSGLASVVFASRALLLDEAECIIAGGMENMSSVPRALPRSKKDDESALDSLEDLILKDALLDAYDGTHMGTCTDRIAEAEGIDKSAQDEYAIRSYSLAKQAIANGDFAQELAPIPLSYASGDGVISQDEGPSIFNEEKLRRLKPAFRKEGSITAGNASSLNDGSAAILLVNDTALKKYELKPLARIIAFGTAATAPVRFPYAPITAMQSVLEKAHLTLEDIDVFEINEAFAVLPLLAIKHLNIPLDKINPRGGAVAIGHPIGASGARILTTLVHHLHATGKKRGLAALCIGGGEGLAVIIERSS